MSIFTERIPVLVSRKEKSEIAKRAKAAGVSMGEYLRRGAKAYRSSAPEEERLLSGLIDRMNRSTEEARTAIEELLRTVEASNRRIEATERRARKRGP